MDADEALRPSDDLLESAATGIADFGVVRVMIGGRAVSKYPLPNPPPSVAKGLAASSTVCALGKLRFKDRIEERVIKGLHETLPDVSER